MTLLRPGLVLGGISLAAMLVIDRLLGPRAEFLNAWSVLERLLGRAPTAGTSVVASRLGLVGEFVVVLAVNLVVGLLLAFVARWLARVA